jgi:hypothetical protein
MMTVSVGRAREFVYSNGTLFERALFAWLFDEGPLDHLHSTIRAYRNPDGGYGHGFEHDIKSPMSHPLALEYLLSVMVRCGIPAGDVLDGSATWMESVQNADGSLRNPPEIKDYPIAPWWTEDGGQTQPASIVSNLLRYEKASPKLLETTKQWAQIHLTPEKIRTNEWLFMAYHAHDYFFAIEDFPNLSECRAATVENIIACAEAAPDDQMYTLFHFAYGPDAPISRVIPSQLIDRALTVLEQTQQEDGGWRDQHDLTQWFSTVTILNILVLRRFGRG